MLCMSGVSWHSWVLFLALCPFLLQSLLWPDSSYSPDRRPGLGTQHRMAQSTSTWPRFEDHFQTKMNGDATWAKRHKKSNRIRVRLLRNSVPGMSEVHFAGILKDSSSIPRIKRNHSLYTYSPRVWTIFYWPKIIYFISNLILSFHVKPKVLF